ncbi:MAG: flavin reductase family protein [Steroidobacteraceae bacterium]|jgi:flavin reductase (DIM6/NTAB) family NADH-FMN oxidoreductase RutF
MPVDSAAYRNAISRFLTGVTIVTTLAEGKPSGLTATAIASVTLEPPTLLACLNRQSATCQAISQSGGFAVNVLASDQMDLAKLFASRDPDKFQQLVERGFELHSSPSGMPHLVGALASIDCIVSATTDVGTHRIFFGEVQNVTCAEGSPLGYFRGAFLE